MEPNVASTDDMPRAASDHATVAGVAALLARYTDRSELLIGYRDSEGNGDAHAQRELTLDVTGDPTFSALLGQVHAAIDGAEQPGQENGEPAELDAMVGPAASLMIRTNGSLEQPAESEPVWGHLRTLLNAAQADPEQPIGALPMLTDAERRGCCRVEPDRRGATRRGLLTSWCGARPAHPRGVASVRAPGS